MLELLAASFVIGLTHAIPPGPITLEVLRRGALEGFFSSFKVNAGAVIADGVYFILIMLGLVQVINNPAGKLLMWIAGCLLLLFIGTRGVYRVLSGKGNYDVSVNGEKKGSDLPPLLAGFSICITSPFALIWWTGVFATSLSVDLIGGGLAEMVIMFSGIAIACLLWYVFVGLAGTASKRFLNEKAMKGMSLLCALMMLAFAAILFYRGYTTFL